MSASTQTRTVFDHDHYLRLIEARGATIRDAIARLTPVFPLSTALDAGCGLGFFAQILHESGLDVRAFDGRQENVEEGKRRFPNVKFEQGDAQDAEITRLGKFDFVLCFGLLYHLENPFAAIRNLRALTGKALLLESMCLPEDNPWMLLREEPRLEDQSLTDVAFYASEGCLAKMLYRAGFPYVYRVVALPDHDDFKSTREHLRRRTVLLATSNETSMPGFTFFPEPKAPADPWQRGMRQFETLSRRVRAFARKPGQQKYLALARRIRRVIPSLPIPMRLPFGAWWLAEHSALDHELMTNGFEGGEIKFVRRFLRPGMTVLDVGAHHGLYTLLASKLVGSTGRVIAFEPSPRERERLQRHLSINGAKNVTVEACAVGASAGESDLFLSDSFNDWCNSLRKTSDQALQAVKVTMRTIDDRVSKLAVTQIDFVKMDIEGGELDALSGSRKLLTSSNRPIILIEVQDKRTAAWNYKSVDIIRLLEGWNFVWTAVNVEGGLQVIDTTEELYDGNFVAVPKERTAEVFAQVNH